MHRDGRADDGAAEGLANGLVAEADAEQRHPGRGGGADQRQADAGLVRRAGAGREQDGLRLHRQGLLARQRVVAPDFNLHSKVAQEVVEIEGKTVVVVDQQDHGLRVSSGTVAGSSKPGTVRTGGGVAGAAGRGGGAAGPLITSKSKSLRCMRASWAWGPSPGGRGSWIWSRNTKAASGWRLLGSAMNTPNLGRRWIPAKPIERGGGGVPDHAGRLAMSITAAQAP